MYEVGQTCRKNSFSWRRSAYACSPLWDVEFHPFHRVPIENQDRQLHSFAVWYDELSHDQSMRHSRERTRIRTSCITKAEASSTVLELGAHLV